MSTSTAEKICSNCDTPLKEGDRFCHQCGQKHRNKKPTLWMILGEFTSSLFNWDSTVYRSFLTMFSPGKLTNAFTEGRIKSFAPPIRVFIVSSFFLVAALSAYNNTEEDRHMSEMEAYNVHRNTTIDEIINLKPTVFNHFPDSSTFSIIDTLVYELGGNLEDEQTISFIEASDDDNADWGLSTTKEIPMIDVIRLSEDSLFRKYEIEGMFFQLFARQQIKNIKDNDGFVNFILSQITIQALLMMPVVALILKLLYWRRERYFVDHFVFSLHYHSFAFVVFGLFILLCHFLDLNPEILLASFIIILLYLFLSMKQVYKQSVGKTLVKYLLLNLIYLFVLTGFTIIAIIISFFIF